MSKSSEISARLRFGLVLVQVQKPVNEDHPHSSLTHFEVAHLKENFPLYFAKRALFPNRKAFQYKPDAQARDAEILGNIRSLALRACIFATSKLTHWVNICTLCPKLLIKSQPRSQMPMTPDYRQIVFDGFGGRTT